MFSKETVKKWRSPVIAAAGTWIILESVEHLWHGAGWVLGGILLAGCIGRILWFATKG